MIIRLAAGTSSRSSKLIHGGLRYLEQGDIGLVREAASERRVLRRIALRTVFSSRSLKAIRTVTLRFLDDFIETLLRQIEGVCQVARRLQALGSRAVEGAREDPGAGFFSK